LKQFPTPSSQTPHHKSAPGRLIQGRRTDQIICWFVCLERPRQLPQKQNAGAARPGTDKTSFAVPCLGPSAGRAAYQDHGQLVQSRRERAIASAVLRSSHCSRAKNVRRGIRRLHANLTPAGADPTQCADGSTPGSFPGSPRPPGNSSSSFPRCW